METIKIIIKDSLATVFNSVDIVSGTSGLTCEFTFNAPWKGLVKNVIFRAGSTTKTVLDIKDDKVEIPKVVLNEVGALLEIGVEGMSPNGRIEIGSIFAVAGRIRKGADTNDTPSGPDIWQQVYVTALEAKELAE